MRRVNQVSRYWDALGTRADYTPDITQQTIPFMPLFRTYMLHKKNNDVNTIFLNHSTSSRGRLVQLVTNVSLLEKHWPPALRISSLKPKGFWTVCRTPPLLFCHNNDMPWIPIVTINPLYLNLLFLFCWAANSKRYVRTCVGYLWAARHNLTSKLYLPHSCWAEQS